MSYVRTLCVAAALLLLAGCAASSTASGSNGAAGPRFQAIEDLVIPDSSEAHVREQGRVPRYPPEAKAAGAEAGFASIYVLDTAGRVEYQTVTFTPHVAAPFRTVVCAYLQNMHFAPVMRQGRPRRALVVMPWTFGLEGGQWHKRQFDAEPLRLALAREGAASAVAQLEERQHCS